MFQIMYSLRHLRFYFDIKITMFHMKQTDVRLFVFYLRFSPSQRNIVEIFTFKSRYGDHSWLYP